MKFVSVALCLLPFLAACTSIRQPNTLRPIELWVDLVSGDEAEHGEVIADLAGAGAIYVGETHTVSRHHAVQLSLLQELFSRGVPLTLCLEQLEGVDQAAVERYNRREIDFPTLAREIDWPRKWSNYADYRPLCEFAQQHDVPIQALNAR